MVAVASPRSVPHHKRISKDPIDTTTDTTTSERDLTTTSEEVNGSVRLLFSRFLLSLYTNPIVIPAHRVRNLFSSALLECLAFRRTCFNYSSVNSLLYQNLVRIPKTNRASLVIPLVNLFIYQGTFRAHLRHFSAEIF